MNLRQRSRELFPKWSPRKRAEWVVATAKLLRYKRHLLTGKAYIPSMTKPQPVLPLPNVTRLRRKA